MDASKLQNEKPITRIDWQQVVLNGGPPCFHVDIKEPGRYCGRAQGWAGHESRFVGHKFVSLTDLLATGRAEAATGMRDKCVDAIKSLRATPHGAAYNNAINDAISKIESLTLDQVKPGER